MKISAFSTVCLSACLFISGCVSSEMMATGPNTYPPRDESYIIDVYTTTDAPVLVMKSIGNLKNLSQVPSGSAEIGRVDTNGAPDASWAAVINDAKKKARELGGDGLIVQSWGSQMTGMNGYGQAYYAKTLSMKVVRYKP